MRFRFQFDIKWCVCVNRLSMANQMRHWRPVGSVRPMRPLILIALRTLHTISSRGNSLSGQRQAAGVIPSDMSLEASLVFVAQFSTTFPLSLSRSLCLPLCSLPNGHINVIAFDRMAAIVGAFTRHMHGMKATWSPSSGEYEHFCAHMQRTTKLGDAGKCNIVSQTLN